jgi:hypothetical protein
MSQPSPVAAAAAASPTTAAAPVNAAAVLQTPIVQDFSFVDPVQQQALANQSIALAQSFEQDMRMTEINDIMEGHRKKTDHDLAGNERSRTIAVRFSFELNILPTAPAYAHTFQYSLPRPHQAKFVDGGSQDR